MPALSLSALKVVNYWPAGNAWGNMWTNWDPGTIDSDFARIATLHANTVRVTILANVVGYPTPSPTMLQRLAAIVALAANHGLHVHFVLFDQWNAWNDLAGSEAWAKAIVAPYAGDPRVAFIDLRNEVDPNDPAQVSWVKHMLPYVRSISSGIPVTVSVSDANSGNNLLALKSALGSIRPDFWDLHYYTKAALAYATFRRALAVAQPLPLLIGETGYSTIPTNTPQTGLAQNQAAQEAYQDQYLRTVEAAARVLNLPLAAPWLLSDLTTTSWQYLSSPTERYYGLYHVDGTPKPAASSITSIFGSGVIDPSFNNGFEHGDGVLPTNWCIWEGAYARFAWDRSVSHSGGASASISHSADNTGALPSFYLTPVQPIEPGKTYTLTAWVKGNGANTGLTQISINWFTEAPDGSTPWLGGVASAPLPQDDTVWTQLSVSATAPANAAYAEIHLQSNHNSGTVWFDDVSFH